MTIIYFTWNGLMNLREICLNHTANAKNLLFIYDTENKKQPTTCPYLFDETINTPQIQK